MGAMKTLAFDIVEAFTAATEPDLMAIASAHGVPIHEAAECVIMASDIDASIRDLTDNAEYMRIITGTGLFAVLCSGAPTGGPAVAHVEIDGARWWSVDGWHWKRA